ncbi:hypothetical protein BH11PSE5_BH11PSE5_10750 [soil metagenome]
MGIAQALSAGSFDKTGICGNIELCHAIEQFRETNTVVESARARRSPQWRIWLPRIWLAIAGLFLLWQTMTYRGISALAAEWQFNKFGFYHPALTYLGMLLILSLPLALLRLFPLRKRSEPPIPDAARMSRTIGRTTRLQRNLLGAAIAVTLVAVLVAIFMLFLPRATGPAHEVVVSDNSSPPPTGPAELRGRVLFDKIAVFNEDFLFTHRSRRFAPVVGDGTDQTVLRYFVEVPTETPSTGSGSVALSKGILRRGGLPGELVQLYRYAGYRVAPDYYVLFESEASMRRDYVTNAVELLVLAFFILLLGGLYSYRRKRLQQQAALTRS